MFIDRRTIPGALQEVLFDPSITRFVFEAAGNGSARRRPDGVPNDAAGAAAGLC